MGFRGVAPIHFGLDRDLRNPTLLSASVGTTNRVSERAFKIQSPLHYLRQYQYHNSITNSRYSHATSPPWFLSGWTASDILDIP